MLPVIVRMSTYPVETLLAAQRSAEDAVRGVLVMRAIAHQAEIDAQSLIADRIALDAATKAAAEVAPQLPPPKLRAQRKRMRWPSNSADANERREAAEKDAARRPARAAAEAARADTLALHVADPGDPAPPGRGAGA